MALVDYFLKIPGVEGDSQAKDHVGEIELESWWWGETQTGTLHLGSGGAGKVAMQDFHCRMIVSKASPLLMQKCATGEEIKEPVILTCRRAGGEQEEYLKWTFSGKVVISSYECKGTRDGDILPTEEISLKFIQIEALYTQGNVKFGYNLGNTATV